MTATNMEIGTGGTKVIVYATNVEKVVSKDIGKPLNFPTSSANWASGPKKTKLVDFLRITTRFNVDGHINGSDLSNFEGWGTQGGVFNFKYNNTDYDVNFEKYTITEVPADKDSDTPRHLKVKFSVIVGENL